MRKTLLCALALAVVGTANAQATLYDNGPMVTHAGQGPGGSDVSMCSVDPNVAGLNRKYFGPDANFYSVADDFTLQANAILTQIVLYGYETGANTPSWTVITVNLWQGQPGAGGNIIATATNITFSQTNIYRCFNGVLTDTTRKINAIFANFANIPLTAGVNYWVSSQITAGGNTGWANMVMDIDPNNPNNPVTRAGNGLQYKQDPITLLYGWYAATSGTNNIVQSEFPFLVKGQPATTTEVLAPGTLTVNLGKVTGGDVASLAADDNNALTVCKFFVPSFTSPILRFTCGFTTTKAAPTAIQLDVKAKMNNAGSFAVRGFLHDYVNNLDVQVIPDTAIALAYATFSGTATGTLTNFVGASNAMQTKVEVQQTGPSTQPFPCASFELVNLKVTG